MTTYEFSTNGKGRMSELISTRSAAMAVEEETFTFSTCGTFSTTYDCTVVVVDTWTLESAAW